MWLGADSSNASTITIAVVGGVGAVLAAVFTGMFAFRGSARNTDAEREKRFDERVDAELTRLRAENDELRRQVIRARYILTQHGVDPKSLE